MPWECGRKYKKPLAICSLPRAILYGLANSGCPELPWVEEPLRDHKLCPAPGDRRSASCKSPTESRSAWNEFRLGFY